MTKRPTLFLMLFVACTTSAPSPNDTGTDGSLQDARVTDAGPSDASLDDADASLNDAGLEDAGLEDAGLEDAGLEDVGLLPASAIGVAICPFEAVCGPVSRRRFVGSCMRFYSDDRWNDQFDDVLRARRAATVPCVLAARTCDEYYACVRSGETCTTSRCDGDVLVDCRGGFAERIDCLEEGLSCVDAEFERAACSLAGSTCGDEDVRCEGEIALWCPGEGQDIPIAFNCPLQGRVCSGFCVDPGPVACTQSTCSDDGTEIALCYEGFVVTEACDGADLDHRCFVRPDDGQARCGIPPGDACERDGARCEGDVAVVCADGKEYELNCARAGAACIDTDGGVNCEIAE